MDGTTKALRRRRLTVVALFAVLLLSACTPDEGALNARDVVLNSNGAIVAIYEPQYTTEFLEDEPSFQHVGAASEVCLEDAVCIRLVGEDTIEESSDGWDTATTVWSVERNASWLQHEYGGAYGFDVGLYDIVAADDQTVAVAAGQLGVITRSVDGEWTPTVAELRTLPMDLRLFVLASALIVLLGVGLAHGRVNYGSGPATTGYLLTILFLIPASLLLLALATNLLFILLFGLAALIAVPGVGLILGAIVRAYRTPGYGVQALAIFSSFTGGLAAVLAVIYLAWSSAILGWNFAVVLSIIAFGASLVGLPKKLRAMPAPALVATEFYSIDNPINTTLMVWVSIALTVISPLLLWILSTLIIAWLTTRLNYNSSALLIDWPSDVDDRPSLKRRSLTGEPN